MTLKITTKYLTFLNMYIIVIGNGETTNVVNLGIMFLTHQTLANYRCVYFFVYLFLHSNTTNATIEERAMIVTPIKE